MKSSRSHMLSFARKVVIICAFAFIQLLHGQSQVENLNLRYGEEQYSILLREANVPLYGVCWKNAIERLHTDCTNLTNELQCRLALMFTNCFLEQSGLPTRHCRPKAEIASCTEKLDTKSFTAYTTFFTHTQNMCFFLKSNLWRRETQNTITRLVDASNIVGAQMEQSMELQQRMIDTHKRSLEQLVIHGHELNLVVEASKASVHDLRKEFLDNADEQRVFLTEIFQHIATVRTLVFGEITSIYSVAYYVCSLPVAYLLTSTKRSEGARFWIFSILFCSLVAENFFVSFDMEDNILKFSSDAQETVYHRTWFLRKFALVLSLSVLLIFAVCYRDLHKINYDLLQQIIADNRQMIVNNREMKATIASLNSIIQADMCKEIPTRKKRLLPESADETCESDYEAEVDENAYTVLKNSTLKNDLSNPDIPTKRRPGRPKGSKSIVSNNSSINDNSVLDSPYNLRERRSRTSMSRSSSAVPSESPEAFALIVKHMAELSKQTSAQLRKTIFEKKRAYKGTLGAQLSSDEDM